MTTPEPEICKNLPPLLSSFIDTFVDFSVSGIFLPPPPPNPNPNPNSPNPNPNPKLQTYYPTPDRLIAIGDVHGDLEKFKQSLRLSNLIDSSDNWCGGSTVVVQIGDILDRGHDEIKSLYFLEKLKRQALVSGGQLITMNGNHELMNVNGDFRYITPESLNEFTNWSFWFRLGNQLKNLCPDLRRFVSDPFPGVPLELPSIRPEFREGIRARIAALRPNGPLSRRFLADNVSVVVVGENVFVHGGLLPRHVEYGLERINEEVRDWINGDRRELWREIGRGRDSVVWLRRFSHEVGESCDCETLEKVLGMIPGSRRMIMGHTIQESGINGACRDMAIRIDVGMSRGCIDGLPEVLEIEKGLRELRVLSSTSTSLSKGYGSGGGGRVLRSGGREGLGVLLEEDRPKRVQIRA